MGVKAEDNSAISISKAIAIILMVIGHSGCPEGLSHFIYLFHMPFFFFVGGLCFKEKYLDDPKTFIKRRLQRLYLPYVKFSLIFLVFHNVFFSLHIYSETTGYLGNG